MNHSPLAATDAPALDGLLLVATDVKKDFVQINIIYNGLAFCIMTCNARHAKEWLGEDAERLVRWDPSFVEDENDTLSGIYRKPSFQASAWVVHWEEIRHAGGDREKVAAILGIALEGEETKGMVP